MKDKRNLDDAMDKFLVKKICRLTLSFIADWQAG